MKGINMEKGDLKNQSLEAGSSVTYSLTTPNGFPILFTFRDDDEKSLLKRMVEMEGSLSKLGFKPQAKGKVEKTKEYAEGNCPICGGKLVKFSTKTGKMGVQCENRKYDFATQKSVGCEYIKWDDTSTDSEEKIAPRAAQSSLGVSATDAQRNLLLKIAPEMWVEGMSKLEASNAIQRATQK